MMKIIYDGSEDLGCKNIAVIIQKDDDVYIRYYNKHILTYCCTPIKKTGKIINYKNYIVFYEPHYSLFYNSAVFSKRDNRFSMIATAIYSQKTIEYDGCLHVWHGLSVTNTHYQIYGIGRDDYIIDLPKGMHGKSRLLLLVSCLHKYDPKLVDYGNILIDFEPKKMVQMKIVDGFWDITFEIG